MPVRRSRRNVRSVIYNAREAESVQPPKGRVKIVDDEEDEESEDEFPEEQDNPDDVSVDEELADDDDDDLDELDDLEPSEEDLEDDMDESDHEVAPKRRARPRPKRSRRVPKPIYPEDVPWKPLNAAPKPDPEELKYHPAVGWLCLYITTFSPFFVDLGGLGPQDIEEGVLESNPAIHKLFARILGLVLNRKKEIEYKRYVSALQELHSQLPALGSSFRLSPNLQWKSQDVFDLLTPIERLEFLHVLAQWSLQNSKTLNQHMSKIGADSVLCYTGLDDGHNRYYFCKGVVGDTRFRFYRETNPYISVVNWTPVASNSDELEVFTRKLSEETGELSQSLVQILEEFLPIARDSEERRIKEQRRQRRHNQLVREAEMLRATSHREPRRTRARRVNYSMMAYDEEFEKAVTRKKPETDKEWGAPPAELGARQSRRIRGEQAVVEETLEEIEYRLTHKHERTETPDEDPAIEPDVEQPAKVPKIEDAVVGGIPAIGASHVEKPAVVVPQIEASSAPQVYTPQTGNYSAPVGIPGGPEYSQAQGLQDARSPLQPANPAVQVATQSQSTNAASAEVPRQVPYPQGP